MSDLTFEYPYALLIIFVFIVCAIFCKAINSSYFFPHLNIYKQTQKINYPLTSILKWITLVCVVIALASPIKNIQTQIIKSNGIDMVLCLDTSASMSEPGFNPNNLQENRWDVVQAIVKDFIAKRVNDNIALIVFGTSVMTASPLSYDKHAQAQIIDYLDIGVAGEKTALIDSIAGGITILKNSTAKSKVIILLTDGEDTASQMPLSVIEKLIKKYGIKVYTIGIGQSNQFLLKHIAKSSKAAFFSAQSKEDLTDIYEQINQLEKSKIDQNKIVLKEYYFFYPLFLGVLSLVFFIYLKNRNELI
ncbi:MAG: vWA domain-containing protein [Candidatus Marinarcus sp.]|uniref:vWA domain-containing protein n=1 Tax=Candidatus Marinarcus sp. TaxID=3100987 RepID=UPI003AFFDF2F